MDIGKKLFEYLELKLPDFNQTRNKKGKILFTCPNYYGHKFKKGSPTAMFTMGDSKKICCLQCGWKGDAYDAVRTVEADKKNSDNAGILKHLMDILDLDVFSELNDYKKLGFSILPVARNGKEAIEPKWQQITHYEKVDWIKWLNNGLNIGLRTGEVSGVTVVDYDIKGEETEEQKAILKSLRDSDTLVQKTPSGGKHFIFKFDEEVPQQVNLGGIHIDTRNTNGYVLVAPSKRTEGDYAIEDFGKEIKDIPKEIREFILANANKSKKEKDVKIILKDGVDLGIDLTAINQVKEGDGRNTIITSLGGLLIKKFNIQQTADIVSIINHNFFTPPLSKKEILNTLHSLAKYQDSDDLTHEQTVYDYCKEMQSDITARDMMDSLQLPRATVDKYLSKFKKEHILIRCGRGRYKFREVIEWSKESPKTLEEYPYEIKYFSECNHFQTGDILLLGGQTNIGKTTIALNMLKHMIAQNVTPYYIYLESGSRFQKTSKILDISHKYFHAYHADPMSIDIIPDSFTIIDWLHISMKEYTDTVFKHLSDEIQRKGGILVVFTQLKETNDWFAPNLIKSFPTFASRYFQDKDNKSGGYWKIDKLKEPKGNYTSYEIPCQYNFETRELNRKDLLY